MIVVSDATPLRYLAVVGHLDFLRRLFGEVHCPETVLKECSHFRAPLVLQEWVRHPPPWLRIDEVPEAEPNPGERLDPGEAAAIALATRLGAGLILIDDLEGRRSAQSKGFATAGTLNILAQAGVRGWIDYREVVGTLRASTNFRMTAEIIDIAWETAQPSEPC